MPGAVCDVSTPEGEGPRAGEPGCTGRAGRGAGVGLRAPSRATPSCLPPPPPRGNSCPGEWVTRMGRAGARGPPLWELRFNLRWRVGKNRLFQDERDNFHSHPKASWASVSMNKKAATVGRSFQTSSQRKGVHGVRAGPCAVGAWPQPLPAPGEPPSGPSSPRGWAHFLLTTRGAGHRMSFTNLQSCKNQQF